MIAPVHLLDSIMKADMAIVEKLKVRSGRTGKLTAAMRRELCPEDRLTLANSN